MYAELLLAEADQDLPFLMHLEILGFSAAS